MSNKCIENPAKFLRESGLLFEINRSILHPYGISLSIRMPSDPDSTVTTFDAMLHDRRDDPDGIVFSEDDFERGVERLFKFIKDNAFRHATRESSLGFFVQGEKQGKLTR